MTKVMSTRQMDLGSPEEKGVQSSLQTRPWEDGEASSSLAQPWKSL